MDIWLQFSNFCGNIWLYNCGNLKSQKSRPQKDLNLSHVCLYGFDSASSAWIESYLFKRKQTVCIDGTCSSMRSLNVGVPQGSIIGPLLYIIFTNDLPESVHGHPPEVQVQERQVQHTYNVDCYRCGSICCFADDSSYSFSSDEADTISEKLLSKYSAISDFMGSHQLKLNSDKTHLLVIRSDAARRSNPEFTVTLNTSTETIQPSKSEKLLGGLWPNIWNSLNIFKTTRTQC